MTWEERNPYHVFAEGVIDDIASLPGRENDSKYVMQVSIDELRAVLASRLWALKHTIRIVDIAEKVTER